MPPPSSLHMFAIAVILLYLISCSMLPVPHLQTVVFYSDGAANLNVLAMFDAEM